MSASRRNVMWPLLIIGIGSIWLLMTAGAFPEAVGDLLLRAWPVLLIIFGLDVLAGQRHLSIFGRAIPLSVIMLSLSVLGLVVVTWLAYQNQADKLRDDKQAALVQPLPEDVSTLRVVVDLQRTSVSAVTTDTSTREVAADFLGGNESDIDMALTVEGRVATLEVRERYPNALPKLEDYGRGTLTMRLPLEMSIEVIDVSATEGDVTLDLTLLRVNQVLVDVDEGDVSVGLPAEPVLQGGALQTGQGGIELGVPENLVLTIGLMSGSGRPAYEYDRVLYDELADGTLDPEPRDGFQAPINISVPGGSPVVVIDLAVGSE